MHFPLGKRNVIRAGCVDGRILCKQLLPSLPWCLSFSLSHTNSPLHGLNGAPNSYVHVLTLKPMNVILFGKKVFTDVIELMDLK